MARQEAGGTEADAGPCPDANELVRMAEGRVLRDERAPLEAHLARCSTCRNVVAAVAGLQSMRRGVDRPNRRLARVAAVAVLLAAAVTISLLWLLRDLERRVEPDADRALLAAAQELVRLEPTQFRDFSPLLHDERLTLGTAAQRGGVALLAPVGKVLEPRPTLRWEDAVGVAEWEVSVLQADGTPLWSARATTPHLAWPADQPALIPGATILCEVVGQGAAGREEARGSFRLALPADVAALVAAEPVIERAAPPRVRAALRAQVALRRGFLAEAEKVLRARLAQVPGDVAARETLVYALEQLGAREATALRAGVEPAAGRGR